MKPATGAHAYYCTYRVHQTLLGRIMGTNVVLRQELALGSLLAFCYVVGTLRPLQARLLHAVPEAAAEGDNSDPVLVLACCSLFFAHFAPCLCKVSVAYHARNNMIAKLLARLRTDRY